MSQNILSLGLDVSSFNEQKKQTLNEYIALFDKLSKYDGMNINPVSGAGFSEFNKSISQSGKLLDELNAKISTFNSNASSSASSSSRAAKSNTELGLSVKAYKKELDDAAKANAKLTALTSDQAKETAALKVQINEIKKAMLEEAKANNESYKSRMASIEAEKRQIQTDKELAAQAKKNAREVLAEQKRTLKEKRDAEKQAEKDAVASLKAQEKAMKDAEKQAQSLADKHTMLKNLLKDQQKEYVNNFVAFGSDDDRTKKSLSTVQETQGIMDGLNVDLRNAEGNASKLSQTLTRGFSVLRNLAYVLPGLGIAGIFTIAFDAIGSAIEATGLFNDKITKTADIATKLNSIYREQLSLMVDLVDKQREFVKLESTSAENIAKGIEVNSSRGFSKDKLLKSELYNLNEFVNVNTKSINSTFGSPENINGQLDNYLNTIKIKTKQLTDIQKQESINQKIIKNIQLTAAEQKIATAMGGYNILTTGQLEASKKAAESEVDIAKEKYKILKERADNYYSSIQNRDLKLAELAKFNEDEARRLRLENAKSEISVFVDTKEQILNAEISSELDRVKALKEIRRKNKELNQEEYINVKTNISSTPADIKIAKKKLNDDNQKLDIKYEEDLLKITEDYRQRRLKATTDIAKDEVEVEAIKNEKVFKNDEKDLDERLRAYGVYIQKKQTLQNLEYQRDIDTLSLKANDPTAKREIEALRSNMNMLKRNIQADAQKQIYDIVSSSLRKELKLVIDTNSIESEENKKSYATELELLNTRYENNNISYENYKKKRKAIDKKYFLSVLDEAIKDDESDIQKLNAERDKILKRKTKNEDDVQVAKMSLQVTTDEGKDTLDAQKRFDSVVGEQQAINDALLAVDKELDKEQKKLDDDKLKRAKRNADGIVESEEDKLKKVKKFSAIFSDIEKALYKAIKQISDSVYADKIAKIEAEKKTVDEAYNSQIKAIEKSSLAQKDKTALDIQLSEQKLEYDKQAALEEKNLKRQQAEFDKQLTIAHIILGTAAAVVEALPDPVKAYTTAAIGAIELVAATAVKIPSYKYGTKPGGHEGGLARYGEAGPEVVKEPYKSPYLVSSETISYLPKGTEIIPIKSTKEFTGIKKDESWEQTKYLAKYIKNNNREIKNVFNPIIKLDLGFQQRKSKILRGY